MANSEYTQEEMQKAADDFSGAMMRTSCRRAMVVLTGGDRINIAEYELELQCSCNRLQEQLNEARELLDLARPASQSIPHKAAWAKKNAEWLSRNR